jgi:hypothetical protein
MYSLAFVGAPVRDHTFRPIVQDELSLRARR